MTVTFSDLILQTERHLMAGDRDALNLLGAAVTDTTMTTLTFTYDVGMIQPGAFVNVDLETMYVWSVNESAKQATVQRGMSGSTAATHTNGSLAYVNPKFSKFQIATEINVEIRDVSGDIQGLFDVNSFDLTTQPVQITYAIPTLNSDILEVLEIRYIEPGAQQRWIRIPRWNFELLRNMPTTGPGAFPSGIGLRIDGQNYERLYPGRPMRVQYAAPLSELTNLTDDVVAVSGLPASAVDIPPLGAAARLMGVREAKRTFTESAVDSRRASEVPSGSAANAARVLLELLNRRIRSEVVTLTQQFPELR